MDKLVIGPIQVASRITVITPPYILPIIIKPPPSGVSCGSCKGISTRKVSPPSFSGSLHRCRFAHSTAFLAHPALLEPIN